jgi:hypothetical protein
VAAQAEIKKKTAEATTNKGGGKAGLVDRKGGAAGHAKFQCPVCGMAAPDLKARSRRLRHPAPQRLTRAVSRAQTMQIHHDSKHPKLPFEPEKCVRALHRTNSCQRSCARGPQLRSHAAR